MTAKRYSGWTDDKYYNVVKDLKEEKIYDDADEIADLLNKFVEENEQLKSKINDTEIAVEIVTEEQMQRVFDLIDKKIDELERKYKFGQEVYHGCPMHNIRFGINTLKELKKELKND